MEELLYEVIEDGERVALFWNLEDFDTYIMNKDLGMDGITIRHRHFKVEDTENDVNC